MIEYHLDAEKSVLHVAVHAALEQKDFAQLAATVDPYIERTGDLAGLIIEATKFPGWESLGAMTAHFRFVRDHHRRIRKIAVVTNSALGDVVETLAAHFVAAKIKRFPDGELAAARHWLAWPDGPLP